MGLKTLDELLIIHGSDKATEHTRTYAKPHGYSVVMEKYFAPLRDKPIKFLEVGIGGGESARAWLDYFENAEIYGVDFVQNTNIFNQPGKPYKRYTFSHGDQTDRTMWKCFLANHGKDWDVIVDDGSHRNDGIITTFEEMWPNLKSGGYYMIEDLGAGCTPGTVFVVGGFPTHMDWIRDRMTEMNLGTNDIESIHLTKELAVFKKR